MIRVSILVLSILLVFVVLVAACELQGTAQNRRGSPSNLAEPNNQRAQETPKKEQQNDQNARKDIPTEWLDYWPAVVELEGNLSIRTFFGPPNFGENPKTDSKQRSRILILDKPISVRAKDENDPTLGPSVENVRELQLISDESLSKLIGRKVIVRGTLLHAHSGYHHTDVLINVESISESKPH